MLIESIAFGLIYGFILFEWSGLVAGGLIAPGYLALYFDNPWAIATCIGTALATYAVVRFLSGYCLLYGRRRFIVCVLIAFFLEWFIVGELMQADFARGSLNLIGFIIPGLLANEMQRQGVGVTLLALGVLSSLVWLTLKLMAFY